MTAVPPGQRPGGGIKSFLPDLLRARFRRGEFSHSESLVVDRSKYKSQTLP
jgi:hypothetical protein